MLASDRFLWNAGIFLARAVEMVAAFRTYAPDLCDPVAEALARARPDLGFLRLDSEAWARAPDISVDYAVMEKARNLSVVLFEGGWSDLGGWNAVWHDSGPDAAGVVALVNATAIDCCDTLLRSEHEGIELVGIGLDQIMAVATQDAVLVADMGRAQEVHLADKTLRARERL